MASSHRQQIGFRRGRRPLGDLTSQQNNLQNLQKQGQQFPGKPVSIIFSRYFWNVHWTPTSRSELFLGVLCENHCVVSGQWTKIDQHAPKANKDLLIEIRLLYAQQIYSLFIQFDKLFWICWITIWKSCRTFFKKREIELNFQIDTNFHISGLYKETCFAIS